MARKTGKSRFERAEDPRAISMALFLGISLGLQQLLEKGFTLVLTTINSFIMGRCVAPIPLILGSGEDSSLSRGNCDALLWEKLFRSATNSKLARVSVDCSIHP